MTTRTDHEENAEMPGLAKGGLEMNKAGLPPFSVAIDMELQAAAPALRKSSRKKDITVRVGRSFTSISSVQCMIGSACARPHIVQSQRNFRWC